jgi:hypothetical protein
MLRKSCLGLACLLLLAASGCNRSDSPPPYTPPGSPPPVSAPAPFRVDSIVVGTAIGADKRVTAPSTTFTPTDKIYASVASDGSAASVTLTARWTYEDGQLVDETSSTLAPTGPAVTEFHIEKPSGWPAGKYRVEVSADGQPAGSRDFEVR